MARIAGIDLPREKMAQYALPVLYGIGKHNVIELLEKTQIDPRKKIKDLDEMKKKLHDLESKVASMDGKNRSSEVAELLKRIDDLSDKLGKVNR